jgi:hypothetical protein
VKGALYAGKETKINATLGKAMTPKANAKEKAMITPGVEVPILLINNDNNDNNHSYHNNHDKYNDNNHDYNINSSNTQ